MCLSIREMDPRKVAEAGLEPMTSGVAGECVSHSATVNDIDVNRPIATLSTTSFSNYELLSTCTVIAVNLLMTCCPVAAPVKSVVIHNSVSPSFISAPSTAAPPGGGRVIHMVENHLVHVRCTTTGGYPPPTVELFVDGRDVTDDFALRQTSTFSGRRSLRQLTYRVERWSQSFRARMSDHNAWLKCIASVQGLTPVIESVRLNVDCKYHFIFVVRNSNDRTALPARRDSGRDECPSM